jgi:hypothetical protein
VISYPSADYPDKYLYEKSADAAKISDNMFAMIQSLVHTDFWKKCGCRKNFKDRSYAV